MKPVICIALLTLCSAAANKTPKATIKTWPGWVSEGKVLTKAGNSAAAAQAFRQALSLAEAANTDERKLLEIYDALASTYAEAGQYSESEHAYRRALALAKKTEGQQSLKYALRVAGMAVLPTQLAMERGIPAKWFPVTAKGLVSELLLGCQRPDVVAPSPLAVTLSPRPPVWPCRI